MKFQHFIITHFNIKFHWKGGHPTNRKLPSKEWTEYRFKLFEKYCYPSLCRQTNQNFSWLVFFDDTITDKKMVKKFNRITPVYISNYDCWKYTDVEREIRRRLKSETKWVITSKIDSDDMFNPAFIQSISRSFDEKEKLIEYMSGLYYDIHSKQFKMRTFFSSPPFLSVIESTDKRRLKTCNFVNHPSMRNHFKNVNRMKDKENLMWCIIIHGKNIINEMRGSPITKSLREKYSKLFNL